MFTGAWTAMITPFKDEGRKIDFDCMSKLVARQIEEGMDGIVIAGTTGEAPTLEKEELLQLVRFVIKEAGGKVPIVVGTGTNCTKKTVEMTERVRELGADGALIIVPYYNKPTDRGVKEHFSELNKLRFPLICYHHPGRTAIRLKLDTIIEIAELEYVVAIKESVGDVNITKELLQRKPDVILLSCDDDKIIELLEMGGRGSVSIMGNILPGLWKEIVHTGSKQLFQEIEPLIRAIFREVNPQGIKCAMALSGLCRDVLRLPMVSVLPETRNGIKAALTGLADHAKL